jgi:DNA-binding HxlR family transcriptional regulator
MPSSRQLSRRPPAPEAQEAAPSLAALIERGELFNVNCPTRDVLRHVTSQWGVLILVALLTGTHRFAELRRKIGGVSEKMLAQTLQVLESDGFVRRTAFPVVPPHVEYDLTPLGVEVARRVETLADWIEENIAPIMRARRLTAVEKEV